MYIRKVVIQNFKCFKDFSIELKSDINIIVGNNETGKSTLLEAIHLALTGVLDGKSLKNELNHYIFNKEIANEYINNPSKLPEVLIEIYFGIIKDENQENEKLDALYKGNANSDKDNCYGIRFKICQNEDSEIKADYNNFLENNRESISSIPIEYYKVVRESFARHFVATRNIPIKSILIDSSKTRLQNGSDMCISYIVKHKLDGGDKTKLLQVYRNMTESFKDNKEIKNINSDIFGDDNSSISNKGIKLSVDFTRLDSWQNTLMTYVSDIPFQYIGQGEQCIIKTNLALELNTSSVILLEEPENHLSHSKLNELLKNIDTKMKESEKQIIISTHSSFVANKMSLDKLILLENHKTMLLKDLDKNTYNFFNSIAGYDTLRLILANKMILVEGDSDELIVQKAYRDKYDKLPIEDGLDVLSVGTSFKRYLKIAKILNKKVIVCTDNDGDIDQLTNKYNKYINNSNIKICYDKNINKKTDFLDINDKDEFNYNTLEPNIILSNMKKCTNATTKDLEIFNEIFSTNIKSIKALLKYMKKYKVKCALDIFNTNEKINLPSYIKNTIKLAKEL